MQNELLLNVVQVTGAKVVTSAKNPGTKCFGLVTMSSAEGATLCIERLNKTEFHGRIISLEKVTGIFGVLSCITKLPTLPQ